MKLLQAIALVSVLILTGCNTTGTQLVTTTQHVVVIPPDNLFYCPVGVLPKEFKSNADVARLLNNLYSDNLKCSGDMNALRQYLLNAQKTIK